jgi:hypothetical protein
MPNDKDEKAEKLSRNEEHEAIELYEHREKEAKDPKFKKVLKHAITEEVEHEQMFNALLAAHEKKEAKERS